jgi:hypothetical protein
MPGRGDAGGPKNSGASSLTSDTVRAPFTSLPPSKSHTPHEDLMKEFLPSLVFCLFMTGSLTSAPTRSRAAGVRHSSDMRKGTSSVEASDYPPHVDTNVAERDMSSHDSGNSCSASLCASSPRLDFYVCCVPRKVQVLAPNCALLLSLCSRCAACRGYTEDYALGIGRRQADAGI